MKIETVNHSDRYSLEQISSLFFSNDSDVSIVSEYNESEKEIKTIAEIEGKTASASYEADAVDMKKFRNSVKKSAYLALKKISDNNTPWGILTGIRPTKFIRELHENMSYEELLLLLTEDYWVEKEKAAFCIDVAKNSEKIINNIKPGTFGLYVGVPFCPSRCSYCSFVSESAALYSKYIPEYKDALIKEIEATAHIAKEFGLKASSVYFGGGTPPTLGAERLSSVIECVRENFEFTDEAVEFTVEAGRPDVINEELLKALKAGGVNRLCINPQTLNNETLKIIGRNHTAECTEKAFELARKTGFGNINSDLIAGLPGENTEIFSDTLEKIGRLAPEGITVHTMYLKRTAKITKEKAWDECGRDVNEMLESSMVFAKANGYFPYYMYKQRSTMGNLENTGYAKKGYESIYNSAIMEEVQTVLACGAGASSKIVKKDFLDRVYNIKDAFSYIRDIDMVIKNKAEKIRQFLAD